LKRACGGKGPTSSSWGPVKRKAGELVKVEEKGRKQKKRKTKKKNSGGGRFGVQNFTYDVSGKPA